MKTLKVIEVSTDTDKQQKPYTRIRLSTSNVIEGTTIKVQPKVQTIIRYPESYLPGNPSEFGHDFKLDDIIAGDIVTVNNLIPYPIVKDNGQIMQVNSSTHVVLGNSDDVDAFAESIKKEFKNRGCFVLGALNSEEGYLKHWKVSPDTGEVHEEVEASDAEPSLSVK